MICPLCEREVRPVHFYRSGKARCQNQLVWTAARRWKLLEMIESGWSDAKIGRRLGCSADAVKLARRRHHLPSVGATVLSSRKVAELLGVCCAKTISRWITRGFLKGRQERPCGPNRMWVIRHAALMTFLEDERYWQLWDPERITDEHLKRWAMKLRGDVRFLTLAEVADRLYQAPATVGQWCHKGWLPSVRMGVDRGNHLVRESDLETFELPKIGQGRRKQAA